MVVVIQNELSEYNMLFAEQEKKGETRGDNQSNASKSRDNASRLHDLSIILINLDEVEGE